MSPPMSSSVPRDAAGRAHEERRTGRYEDSVEVALPRPFRADVATLIRLTTTQPCWALPGRFESAQGGSAKTDVHKSVHKRHENDPRGRTSGVISASSGDRIRTCDLWVMS